VTLSSFELINPENIPFGETLEIYKNVSPPVEFQFSYPQSWQLQPNSDTDQNILELLNQHDEKPVGRIRIQLIPLSDKISGKTIIKNYTELLKQAGYLINGAPLIPIPVGEQFKSASVAIFKGSYEDVEMEFPVYAIEQEKTWFHLALIGPSRQTAPEWWAINKRAFEIVRDSVQILPE